jgi:hypothetical protein
MKRVTGTLRVDARIDDLPEEPIISIKIVRQKRPMAQVGFAVFDLFWPDRGDWYPLGTIVRPAATAHLEDIVLSGLRLAYDKGIAAAAANECTILNVWRKV